MDGAFNAAMLILRVGIGIVFLAHGIKHLGSREKTIRWFESIGFRQAGMQWFVMTATEIGAGVLLIAGLLNSLAAGAVVGTMAVAFWTVHRAAGFFITAFMKEGIDVEGWEYVFTLAFAAGALAVAGPGEWSLDHQFEIATDLDGWVGAAIVAGSLLVSVLQLATFYRPSKAASG